MRRPSALRFFGAIIRPSILQLIVMAAVILFGVWTAWNDPRRSRETTALLLMLQMFAAASGFREPATRGYFDAVLSGGGSRLAVAGAHYVASVLPGLVAWVLTAILLYPRDRLLIPGDVVAFAYVSSVTWAFALPLTRYASGTVWTIGLVLLAGMGELDNLRATFFTANASWAGALSRTAAAAICPIFLLENGETPNAVSRAGVAALGLLAWAAGALYIKALDAPLKDRS
jgi:hypothetical protein